MKLYREVKQDMRLKINIKYPFRVFLRKTFLLHDSSLNDRIWWFLASFFFTIFIILFVRFLKQINFNIHLKAFYCINKDLPTSLVLEQPVCERAPCVMLIFDLQLYHLQKRQL